MFCNFVFTIPTWYGYSILRNFRTESQISYLQYYFSILLHIRGYGYLNIRDLKNILCIKHCAV